MAERSRGRQQSTKRTEARQKQAEAEAVSAEQKMASLLDDPAHPDQASPLRGALYFAIIVGFALLLNLALMIVISGGQ